MDNISFRSRIVLTTTSGYNRAKLRVPAQNFINYPWTVAQGKIASCVGTSNISDCGCGFVTDRTNVAAVHLDPLNPINRIFSNVVKFFKEKEEFMNNKKQALVIGGKAPCIAGEESYKQIDNLVNYFETEGIPCSILKGGMGKRHVCYFSDKDEYVIGADIVSNWDPYEKLTAEQAFKRVFNEIKVAPEDKLIFQRTWF